RHSLWIGRLLEDEAIEWERRLVRRRDDGERATLSVGHGCGSYGDADSETSARSVGESALAPLRGVCRLTCAKRQGLRGSVPELEPDAHADVGRGVPRHVIIELG